MRRVGARDFDALVDSFYGIVCALVEHRLTVSGDALFAMRSVLHLDAEFRAFCDARLRATDGRSPKRVSLENKLVKSARTLQATFIDEKLATLVVGVRAWLLRRPPTSTSPTSASTSSTDVATSSTPRTSSLWTYPASSRTA